MGARTHRCMTAASRLASPTLRTRSCALVWALLALGCGAREGLLTGADSTGVGGAGDETSTAASAGRGSGGAGATGAAGGAGGEGAQPPVACSSLQLLEPLFVLPDSRGDAVAPDVALGTSEEDVVLAWIGGQPGGPLQHADLNAFETWPPTLGTTQVGSPVGSFVLGQGIFGPVGWARDFATDTLVLLRELGGAGEPMYVTSGTPLFVAGLGDGRDGERYLFASRNALPSYQTLGVGSYQSNSLPQGESPFACLDSEVLAAAVVSRGGFLGVYAMTDPATSDCPVGGEPGASVGIYRYDSPAEPGSDLQAHAAERFQPVLGDPLAHVAIARTSFGAWVLYQNAGTTSVVPPPPMVLRVDPQGQRLVADDLGVPAAPPDSYPWLAAAAFGDAVAVAYSPQATGGAPEIVVQVVLPSGISLEPVHIDIGAVPQQGRLRMVGSQDGQHLLVVWEARGAGPRVAAARIDCIERRRP